MKTEQEIINKIKSIKEEYERAKPVITKCKCCGQTSPIMGTFMISDGVRFESQIRILEWVLGEKK